MNRIKAVIFDLDGTLLNTLEDLADSVNYALSKFDMKPRTLEEIRGFIGNGVYMLIKRSVEEDTPEQITQEVLSVFREHYATNCENKTKPYDGICDMLRELQHRNIKTAVVSNKFDKAVKMLCAKYFGQYISVAIGEGEGIRRKPCPDGISEALKILGISAHEAVYVGDSDVDILTSKNADMRCISVSWGFKSREQLIDFGASEIVDKPKDIIKYFKLSLVNHNIL